MQTKTLQFAQMEAAGNCEKQIRVDIDGTSYFADKIVSMQTTGGLFRDGPKIGTTTSTEIYLNILAESLPRGALVEPFVRMSNGLPTVFITDESGNLIKTDDGFVVVARNGERSEWIPQGKFFIDTQPKDQTTGVISVHGYDAMMKTNQPYLSFVTEDGWPKSAPSVVAEICTRIGVELDARSSLDASIMVGFPNEKTMRQVLGEVSAAHAANATITDAGKLLFVPLRGSERAQDVQNIGTECEDALFGPKMPRCTGVRIFTDDDRYIFAGNETGYVFEVEIDWADQTTANKILQKLNGFEYQPATITEALISPALEFGDRFSADGKSTVVYWMDRTIDQLYTADVTAAEEKTIDHEYPYLSEIQRKFDKELAKTRSAIKKTSDSISLIVENDEVKADLIVQLLNGQSTIKLDSNVVDITADNINLSRDTVINALNGSGSLKINASVVNMTGAISWQDLDLGTQTTISGASTNAAAAVRAANAASTKVNDWAYNGGTYIDGTKIMANTVTAGALSSGEISIGYYGFIYAGTNTSGSTALEIYGTYGIRLIAAPGRNAYIAGGNGNAFITLTSIGDVSLHGDVYVNSSPIGSSDRNLKEDILYNMEAYDGLLDKLRPTQFKFKDGRSHRFHTGMIAQDVEQALSELGIRTEDFAGFARWNVYEKENGEDTNVVDHEECGIRYEEFIALLIWEVQKLKHRVEELEVKNG